MVSKTNSNKARLKRHGRIRNYISGTAERPRLNVFRSLNTYGGNKEAAKEVGKLVAQKAIEAGISEVVFDRGGYIYHGRVAELAAGAREGGLKF